MSVWAFEGLVPRIDPTAYVHPAATVIGDVTIGALCSIWPGAVLRGDFGAITVGDRSAIQDGAVVHSTPAVPTTIGSDCLLGHLAHVEGCSVGDACLIGSGAVVLNFATIEAGAVVAAAALVPERRTVPTGHIASGIPCRTRPALELERWTRDGAAEYAEMTERYRTGLTRIS